MKDVQLSGVTTFSLALLLGALIGCESDSESAKRSHFEHDHEVADHWPSDLADVAKQIRDKLDLVAASDPEADHLCEEISDLVGWTPEIAADTDLSESDWLPLHRASELLSARLNAAGYETSQPNREQALKFCELIDEAVAKLNEKQVSIEDKTP